VKQSKSAVCINTAEHQVNCTGEHSSPSNMFIYTFHNTANIKSQYSVPLCFYFQPEPTVTGTETNDLEESQNNGKPDVTSNTKALPPSEPSLFESIFGPLEKQEDVKCVENVIQELSDQPAQPTETTVDDLTKNNDAVTSSESG